MNIMLRGLPNQPRSMTDSSAIQIHQTFKYRSQHRPLPHGFKSRDNKNDNNLVCRMQYVVAMEAVS